MKNNQFSPMTEKEMMAVNGGGLVDGLIGTLTGVVGGLPLVGPLLTPILNTVKQLLASLNLPV